jgi:hypothetical protein
MRGFELNFPTIRIWSLLGLCAFATTQAQQDNEVQPLSDEDLEALPKFEVEFIAFAYNDFDPNEERFEELPRGTLLDLLNPSLLDTDKRNDTDKAAELSELLSTIDEEQPTLVPTDAAETSDSTPPHPIDEILRAMDEAAAAEADPLAVDGAGIPINSPDSDDISTGIPPDESLTYAYDPSIPSALEEPALDPFTGEPIDPPVTDAEILTGDELLVEEESDWYRILSAEELELTDTAARLERLDAYTPLVHGGWVQEGLPETEAIPFDLSLLGRFNPRGTIQLHVSRFLHVTVALKYQSDRPPGELLRPVGRNLEEISFPPRYLLHTQRRTRSGEVHFFDHPAFGVLVLVRPAPEEPELTEEEVAPAA